MQSTKRMTIMKKLKMTLVRVSKVIKGVWQLSLEYFRTKVEIERRYGFK
jgi:hypothetical protein